MSKTLDRYLYSVHSLKERYLVVRAVDVAHDLGVSKASVSLALRQLREEGLILTEPDGNLLLSSRGVARAEALMRRIAFFAEWLTEAGVDPDQARRDAAAFGWEMSEASFQAFRAVRERK